MTARASFALVGVSVAYAGREAALTDVDLEIAPGEAVGFVGPSGAGKTTLLRLLGAALRPSRGAVWVGGEHLASLSPARLREVRSRIGVVHQELDLVPSLRVISNVLAGRLGRVGWLGGLRLLLMPPRAQVRRVFEILERVGVAEKLYERTDRLSGGQRQRVAIARALYQDTVALLADLSRERRLTLAMSLHNLELARAFLPRLVGLRRGRVVFDRATAELTDADFHALYDLAGGEVLTDAPA